MRRVARRGILRIGKYLEHRGRLAEALRVYRSIPALIDPSLEFAIGNVLYRQERYHAAIPYLDRALQQAEPEQIMLVYKRLAIAHIRVGGHRAAVEVLENYLEKVPGSAWAVEMHGNLISSDSGQGELQKLVPQASSIAPPWQRVNNMRRTLCENSDDAEWLYRYASALQESGRLAEAAVQFDAANRHKEKSWWAYRAGLAYELAGKGQKANVRYEKAITGDTELEADKWGIGAFHDRAGRFDLAGREYEEQARSTSDAESRARLYARAGRAYLLALDVEASVKAYRRATDLRPRHADWLLEMAAAHEIRKDWIHALAALARARTLLGERRSRANDVDWRLAWVLYQQGEYGEALNLLIMPENGSDAASENSEGVHFTEKESKLTQPALHFIGSADQKGLVQRARVLEANGQRRAAYRAWRMASIVSAPVPREIAVGIVRTASSPEPDREAVEAILATRLFNSQVPSGAFLPKEGTYQHTLAIYSEHRERRIYEDVIIYETNLGLSVDCNPLALCREILRSCPSQYIHVWAVDENVPIPSDLAESPDVVVVRKNSDAYVSLLARAKYLVNNSTFPTYFTRRDQQRYLMTWHGTPLKTLGRDQPTPLPHSNMARNLLQATYVIFPNQHTRDVLIEGCDVAGLLDARVEISGYPRNDILVNLDEEKEPLHTPATVLFAPTWREEDQLDAQADTVLSVRRVLEEAGFNVLVRVHHYVEETLRSRGAGVQVVPRYRSTIDLLPEVDLLVTDFSSIFFDFAITGRPIIFHVPDWDQYKESRGLYFEKEDLPGEVCEDLDQLVQAVVSPKIDPNARSKFLRKFAPMDDGRAAERVAHYLLNSRVTQSAKPNDVILFRQSLLPNGMSSSFINLAHTLVEKNHQIAVLTDGRAVQEEPQRWNVARRLPTSVRVIGRVGMQPKTRLEIHAHRVLAKTSVTPSEFLEKTVNNSFVREARRVIPSRVKAAIEFDGYSEFMARLVAAIGDNGTKRGLYLHSDFLDEIRMRMPELERVVQIFPRFDSVVSVSEGLREVNAEKLGNTYGVDSSNFRWARNEIIPKQIIELADHPLSDDEEAVVKNASPLIVHVGRFSPEKNHLFLLDVIQELLGTHPNAHLLFLGDGPLFDEVRTEVASRGLRRSVTCLGQVENPYRWMARSDVLVLPSLHEGQPMVILEAKTLGIPVVASSIPGVLAMKGDGATKTLPLEVAAWVSALACTSDDQINVNWNSREYVDDAYQEFLEALDLTEVQVPDRGRNG